MSERTAVEIRAAMTERTASEIRAYLVHNENTDTLPHGYVEILEEDVRQLLEVSVTGWALLAQMMRGGYAVSTEGMLWVRENESWLADSLEPALSPGDEKAYSRPWENSLGLYRAGRERDQTLIVALFSSMRIPRLLARQGIAKAGQVRWLLETYGDDGLLWIRGFGATSLLRLKKALLSPDGENEEESEHA